MQQSKPQAIHVSKTKEHQNSSRKTKPTPGQILRYGSSSQNNDQTGRLTRETGDRGMHKTDAQTGINSALQ